jgi:hypothetical protein
VAPELVAFGLVAFGLVAPEPDDEGLLPMPATCAADGLEFLVRRMRATSAPTASNAPSRSTSTSVRLPPARDGDG